MLNPNRFLLNIFCALFLTVLCTDNLPAAYSGKISGTIINADTEEPIQAANIFISGKWENDQEIQIESNQGAASDEQGDYYILNVKPGTYTITCQSMGFAKSVIREVSVNSNRTTPVDFTLYPSTMELQEVVVNASQEVIKQDVSASKYYIRSKDIENLPLEGLDEILSTQLGIVVKADADGAGFSIRGGGIDETDIIIDGISLMNQRTQVAVSSVNMTSIEEIEILSGGFNAEFGSVRSGVINIVTKESSDKISFSSDFRYSDASRKHFGPSPYSPQGPFWQVYAGDKAFTGVSTADVQAGDYPFEFVGWNQIALNNAKDNNPNNDYTPQEALEIWKWRHREIEYANKPDIIADFTIAGPTPIEKLNFMYSQRYEDTQYYLPSSRKNYFNTVSQLKFNYRLSDKIKLSWNTLYNFEEGVGGGSVYQSSPAVINGSREAVYSMSYMYNSPTYLWAEGAYNPMENTTTFSGFSMSYILNRDTFLDLSAELTIDETRQEPIADRDTSGVKLIGDTWYDEGPRGHVGEGAEQWDQLNQTMLGGLGRGQNHSKYNSFKLSGKIVSQVNKYNQVKSGFSILLAEFKERELVNSGGGEYTYEEQPANWIYYDETPVTINAYVQDKLEFEGMVANFGLRMDYFNPCNDPFDLSDPFNTPYYGSYYEEFGNYDSLRTNESTGKMKFSPRLGISHPISDVGKIYFNYGHFYQVPHPRYYFNVRPINSSHYNIIPNLLLDWPKTIQYEIGYEHNISNRYLLHVGAYYKDVSNEIVQFEMRNGEMGMGDIQIITWDNNQYADYRGIELRFEKNQGEFLTFFSTLQYSVTSRGRTGDLGLYEDNQLIEQQMQLYEQQRDNAVPSASISIDLHTPSDYGPKVGDFYPIGGLRASVVSGWSDGGKGLYDENAALNARRWIEYVDWSNTDLMIEKSFRMDKTNYVLYAQVTNLLNQKRLSNIQSYVAYLSSLHLDWESGEQKGNDKYGEYDEDYHDLGWYTWTQFLNPRDITLGIRISF